MSSNTSANTVLQRGGNGDAYREKTFYDASTNSHVLVVTTDTTNPVISISADGSNFVANIDQSTNTLTSGTDLGTQRLHRIRFPAAWTAAAVTFQSSTDGSTWSDLYNEFGEYTLSSSVVGVSRSIVLDQSVFYGIRYIRIRSGTSATPVQQASARALNLVTVPR